MKKVYSLAIAAAVSVSAYANVDLTTSKVTTLSADQMNVSTEFVVSNSDMQKAPAKTAIAQDQVLDTYLYHANNRASGDSGGEHSQMLTVIMDGPQDGDSHGENCSLYGIYYGMQIRAVFDSAAGTIRIYEQPLVLNTYYNEMVYLYPEDAQTSAKLPYIQFDYEPNGVELTSTSTGEKFTVAENGFFAPLMNQLTVTLPSFQGTNSGWMWKYQNWFDTVEVKYPESYLNYVDSEWDAIGNATIEDGWVRATCNQGQSLGKYSVPCKQHKTNKNLYALENPYGTGTPYAQFNTLNVPGKIIFEVITEDVENEDGDLIPMTTVAVRPFVLSGYDNVETVEAPVYCTNLEGKYHYLLGSTIEDMYYDFSDMDYPMSTVSEDGLTMTLPNCRVQMAGEDAEITDQWTNSDGNAIPMETVITVPNAGSVHGVMVDAENTVTRYFNLQGMEISNPEAGQVVIVREGKKATKVIVK